MLTHLLALLLLSLQAQAVKPSKASVRIFLAAGMTEMYPQMVTPEFADTIAAHVGDWTKGQWKCVSQDKSALDLQATRPVRSLTQVGQAMSVVETAIEAHKPKGP